MAQNAIHLSSRSLYMQDKFKYNIHHHHHHHHHLALQPFVGFRLLSQASPSSSVLSCFLPVFFYFLACLNLP